jgi:hypothetical protein
MLFIFFEKWFCEKSRSKEGFLFFPENGFVKNLALKKAFQFFGEWFCEKSRSKGGFLFFAEFFF